MPTDDEIDDIGGQHIDIETMETSTYEHALCIVCGIKSIAHCGKCREVYYCGVTHQKLHWKEGLHKHVCSGSATTPIPMEDKNIKYVVYYMLTPYIRVYPYIYIYIYGCICIKISFFITSCY